MAMTFSQAAENNKQAILKALQTVFRQSKQVLEIGSGTGQHAEFFSTNLPQLDWQASDIKENLEAINERFQSSDCTLVNAIELNMESPDWPAHFDAVFSANTAHIMAWPLVETMIKGLAEHIQAGGIFCLYGPFNYNGNYTSDSNQKFDGWLKNICSSRGIRDFEKINHIALNAGLHLQNDIEMPANNRLLVWQRNN